MLRFILVNLPFYLIISLGQTPADRFEPYGFPGKLIHWVSFALFTVMIFYWTFLRKLYLIKIFLFWAAVWLATLLVMPEARQYNPLKAVKIGTDVAKAGVQAIDSAESEVKSKLKSPVLQFIYYNRYSFIPFYYYTLPLRRISRFGDNDLVQGSMNEDEENNIDAEGNDPLITPTATPTLPVFGSGLKEVEALIK